MEFDTEDQVLLYHNVPVCRVSLNRNVIESSNKFVVTLSWCPRMYGVTISASVSYQELIYQVCVMSATMVSGWLPYLTQDYT